MKKFLLFIPLLLVCLLSCVAFGSVDYYASASSVVYVITETNYTDYGISTNNYEIFHSLAEQVLGDETTSFKSNLFSTTSDEIIASSPSSADGLAIKEDVLAGVLDLTVGENARYDCLKNKSQIVSLEGFNVLSFNGIETLYLQDNRLESIEASELNGFSSLKNLYLDNNQISQFEIGSYFDNKIEVLSLSNNKLDRFMSSCLKDGAELNLRDNLITDMVDISVNGKSMSSVDLRFNRISIIDMSLAGSIFGTYPLVFVQNIKDDYSAGEVITIVNEDNYNLRAHVSYSSTSLYWNDGEDIDSTSGALGVDELFIPAGKITISFTYDSLPLDVDPSIFDPIMLSVAPTTPNYSIMVKGAKSNSLEQRDNFEVAFEMNVDEDIPNAQVIIEDSQLRYYVNGRYTNLENNKIYVNQNGVYNIKCYAVFDGIESEAVSITVKRNNTTGILFGAMLALLVIIAVGATVVLRRWFNEGGNVAPLSDAEIKKYRLNRQPQESVEQVNIDKNDRKPKKVVDEDWVDLMPVEKPKDDTIKIAKPNKNLDDFPEDI